MKKEIKSDIFDFNKEFKVEYAKQISDDKALAIFKEIEAGTNKKICTDKAVFMHGSWARTNYVEYLSDDYEVHSTYNVGNDKYVTQVFHYVGGTVDVYNVENKMIQRLLHHFVVPIKTKRIK